MLRFKSVLKESEHKSFWKKNFEKNSSMADNILSHKVNGFIDQKLVIAIRSRITQILLTGPCKSIIDCGCGDGSVTMDLIGKDFEVIGIDFSQQMCQLANDNAINAICADIDELGSKNIEDFLESHSQSIQYNHLFLFCESLGCLPLPLDSLANIANMNKTATLLISFPNPNSVMRQAIRLVENTGLTYFDYYSLASKLSQCGRNILSVYAVFSIPFCVAFSLSVRKPPAVIMKAINLLANNWIVLLD